MSLVPSIDLASRSWPNSTADGSPLGGSIINSKPPFPAYRIMPGTGVTFDMDNLGAVTLAATGLPLTNVDGGTF